MTNIIGQALCCGQIPSYGRHNYHVWDGKMGPGNGFFCEICKKSASTLGGNVPFDLETWNRKFQPCECNEGVLIEPKLNAPEGFRWGNFNIENSFVGGKQNLRLPFVLFKTSHNDVLKDLTILFNGKEINLDWFCQARNCQAYIAKAWCTDKTSWYSLNLSFYNAAQKHLTRFLEETGLEFPENKSWW